MKNLICKKGVYYLSDDKGTVNGTSKKVTDNNIANTDNIPNKRFKSSIVIYGRYTCPYCIALVELLKTKPALDKRTVFVEVDMADEPLFKKTKLLKLLKTDIANHTTVPIVFDKGKFVGGSSDAKIYFELE